MDWEEIPADDILFQDSIERDMADQLLLTGISNRDLYFKDGLTAI